jgi:hypothetical protein
MTSLVQRVYVDSSFKNPHNAELQCAVVAEQLTSASGYVSRAQAATVILSAAAVCDALGKLSITLVPTPPAVCMYSMLQVAPI